VGEHVIAECPPGTRRVSLQRRINNTISFLRFFFCILLNTGVMKIKAVPRRVVSRKWVSDRGPRTALPLYCSWPRCAAADRRPPTADRGPRCHCTVHGRAALLMVGGRRVGGWRLGGGPWQVFGGDKVSEGQGHAWISGRCAVRGARCAVRGNLQESATQFSVG
jgi:hypothetical protein